MFEFGPVTIKVRTPKQLVHVVPVLIHVLHDPKHGEHLGLAVSEMSGKWVVGQVESHVVKYK